MKTVSVEDLLAEADARDAATAGHHDDEDEAEAVEEFGTARQVRFINKLKHPIEIFWVKPGAANQEVLTAELARSGSPRSETQLGSYVGHMFVFRRKGADAQTTPPLDWFRCRASKPKRGFQKKVVTKKSVKKAKVDTAAKQKYGGAGAAQKILAQRALHQVSPGRRRFDNATHELEKAVAKLHVELDGFKTVVRFQSGDACPLARRCKKQ